MLNADADQACSLAASCIGQLCYLIIAHQVREGYSTNNLLVIDGVKLAGVPLTWPGRCARRNRAAGVSPHRPVARSQPGHTMLIEGDEAGLRIRQQLLGVSGHAGWLHLCAVGQRH